MRSPWFAIVGLLFAAAHADAPAPASSPWPAVTGQMLLDNPHVSVQRLLIAPGQSTGTPRASNENALAVFVHGGVLRSDGDGRETRWRDGRVVWHGANQPQTGANTNVGPEPIEVIWVTLKPAPAPPAGPPDDRHLNYPNIAGEDLLDNERVVVQRFVVNPGQWEGVHAHRPGMLYIHVRGGQWAARSKSEPEHRYPNVSADGSVGWMSPIALSEGHESGNVGPNPIDLIWVTLKQ